MNLTLGERPGTPCHPLDPPSAESSSDILPRLLVLPAQGIYLAHVPFKEDCHLQHRLATAAHLSPSLSPSELYTAQLELA
jgi:hypothetical protein